jgi:hypothetical protein
LRRRKGTEQWISSCYRRGQGFIPGHRAEAARRGRHRPRATPLADHAVRGKVSGRFRNRCKAGPGQDPPCRNVRSSTDTPTIRGQRDYTYRCFC